MLRVFDGHNDTLSRFYDPRTEGSFLERGESGHLDLPRALEAGFGGGVFAIMAPRDPAARRVPPRAPTGDDLADLEMHRPVDGTFAQRFTISVVASLLRLERASAGRVAVVRDAGELRACLDDGRLAGVLHFEGAEAIDPELNALEVFHRAGLRSLGLVWSRPNAFASGVPFRTPGSPDTGPGLTAAGRELVRACNELGIAIDLSHLNERGFWDVAGLSSAPLVASHSNAHAICPCTRNLLDAQLDAIRDSGGIVGVNFAVDFLRPDGERGEDAPMELVVRHFAYLADRMGVDHVGFGSDFDGATIPKDIGDVTGLPRLLDALRAHGFGEPDLRKLAHENWVRVLDKIWSG